MSISLTYKNLKHASISKSMQMKCPRKPRNTCKILLKPFGIFGAYVAVPPPRILPLRICMCHSSHDWKFQPSLIVSSQKVDPRNKSSKIEVKNQQIRQEPARYDYEPANSVQTEDRNLFISHSFQYHKNKTRQLSFQVLKSKITKHK